MLDTIAGLPIHPLVVHATVVVVPVAALAVAVSALWPRFRLWAGWLPLALSVVALVLVPLSTSSGESLEERVAETAQLEQHAELGEGLLVWVVVLAVAAVALRVRDRMVARRAVSRADSRGTSADGLPARRSTGVLVTTAAALLLVGVGVGGTLVQTVLIGHSGAQAAWGDVAPAQPDGGEDDD